jgi:hypothetical protein
VKIVLCGPANLLHLSSTLTGQAGAYVSQATVTEQCAAENDTPDSAEFSGALAPCAGFWFLVHGVNYAEDDSDSMEPATPENRRRAARATRGLHRGFAVKRGGPR